MPKNLIKKGTRPIGRALGTPNKITKTQRELMLNILRNEEEKIVKTLASLGGVTYLKYVSKLVELITPNTKLDPVVEPILSNTAEAIVERAKEEWAELVKPEPQIKLSRTNQMIEDKRLADLERFNKRTI